MELSVRIKERNILKKKRKGNNIKNVQKLKRNSEVQYVCDVLK